MPRSSLAIRLTVLATTLVLVLCGVVSYIGVRSAAAASLAIAQTEATSLDLERVLSVARDAETGQRGFLLTGDANYLQPYYAAIANLAQRLSVLRASLAKDSGNTLQLDELQRLIKAKTDELTRTVELRQAGDPSAAMAIVSSNQGKRLMDSIRQHVAQMQDTQTQALAAEVRTASRARLWTSASILAVWAFALTLVLVLIVVVQRDNERIRLGEERLAITLRSIGDAVIATDEFGRVHTLNAVAEELTGWQTAEARDAPLDRIFRIGNEETRATVESPVDKTLRQGSTVGLANHTLLIARDGTETPIEDSAAPIRDAGGKVVGVVLVFRDASLERSIARSLRDADRKKDEFIAVLAHELRNPLAPILQAAQLVQTAGASPAQLQWSHEVIARQAKTMGRLLDDLLDVSRITRGTLEVRKSRVALDPLIRGAIETTRPAFDARHHTLLLDLPPETIELDADPVRMTQVIANLLMNAAKYTDEGGTIRLLAKRESNELVLSVVDNGIGLDQQALPRVFDMFVQVEEARDRHEGGLGIGLALAKRLVELHHGSIEVRSDGVGLGSEFTVRVPCRLAQPAAVAAAAPPEPEDEPAKVSLRIVIADDNRDAAESLAILLQMDGHEVSLAHDGEEALGVVTAVRPHVAVLDIGMPGMNGYELARRIRASVQSEPIVLIALTGWGQAQDLQRARAAGFDHHLIKPAEPGALRSLITTIGTAA
jgi:PAS domain S-box-containing protein